MEKWQARSFNFLVPGVGLEEFSTNCCKNRHCHKQCYAHKHLFIGSAQTSYNLNIKS